MTRSTIDPQQALADGYQHALALIERLPRDWYQIGVDWYPMAHERIRLWAMDTSYSESQVAATLALNNINRMWAASKGMTRQCLYYGLVRGPAPYVAGIQSILALPRDASHDAVLPHLTNGSKTNHFYWALLDIAGCPCDRWIFSVWRLPHTERHYPLVEAGVCKVAAHLGLEPRHGQSLIWIARVYAKAKTMQQYMP